MSVKAIHSFLIRLLLVSGSCFVLFSNAQAVNMQYLKYSPVSEFTDTDFELLQTTGVQALNEYKNGQMSEWKNEETGHSGTITPLDTSEINGYNCRKTRISNHTQEKDGQAVFTFCKIDGHWKILK